jgi:hypothetical protein
MSISTKMRDDILELSLDDYINKSVVVSKNKQNKDPYECDYFDYRVGCDICHKGGAFGLKTNFTDLIKKDKFRLNDIKIIPEDWYPNITKLYRCTDKSFFKELYTLSLKIETSFVGYGGEYYWAHDENNNHNSKYKYCGGGITTTFFDFDDASELLGIDQPKHSDYDDNDEYIEDYDNYISEINKFVDNHLNRINVEYVNICHHCINHLDIAYPQKHVNCYPQHNNLFEFYKSLLRYLVKNIDEDKDDEEDEQLIFENEDDKKYIQKFMSLNNYEYNC